MYLYNIVKENLSLVDLISSKLCVIWFWSVPVESGGFFFHSENWNKFGFVHVLLLVM